LVMVRYGTRDPEIVRKTVESMNIPVLPTTMPYRQAILRNYGLPLDPDLAFYGKQTLTEILERMT
jgi:hypothetical protein